MQMVIFINLIFLLCGNDINEIADWLNKKRDKFTCHDIQNGCLKLMALNIVKELSQNICTSTCYTIMADKYTDKANHEQFTICIRWIGVYFQDHENFVGLYHVGTIDATCLEHVVTDTLLCIGVSLSHCIGQCYEGAELQ